MKTILSHPAWSGVGVIVTILALVWTIFGNSVSDSQKAHTEILGNCTWKPKSSFDGRVGPIVVENTSLYTIGITLWHPDSRSAFKSYSIAGQKIVPLDLGNPKVGIGSDWGIQIGESLNPVCSLYEVAKWKSAEGKKYWYFTPETFFKE